MNDDKWVDAIEERMKVEGSNNHIDILETEINVLGSRLKENGTGHLHTAIFVLTERVKELRESMQNGKEESWFSV